MNRITRFIAGALLCALFTAPLTGQTSPQSSDAIASITIAPYLQLSNSSNMNFGTHFANEGSVSTGSAGFARWNGVTDPGNTLTFAFVLPTQLVRQGGGPNPVLFACGTTAGHVFNSIDQRFNPATGGQFTLGGGGEFNVDLGWAQGAPGSNECTVNISGRVPGVYTGTITLTVTVL